MSTQKDIIQVDAGEDLSQRQYHAVNVSGTLAADVEAAMGILQNKPDASGEDASALIVGPSFFRAGAAISAGDLVTVTTSGWFIVSDSGDQIAGKAISGVASGGIAEGRFNFATPGYSIIAN